jgi:membrane associated rhomboid family serine protease
MDDNQTEPTSPWAMDEERPAREPIFNAPWTILALGLGLIALYAMQQFALSSTVVAQFALSPTTLTFGGWPTLATSMFLHASWAQVLFNAVMAVAFGAASARLMGTDLRGAAAFFGFYLTCGLGADLAYAVLHTDSPGFAVGATGAISGLFGAAARVIQGRGKLGALLGFTVIAGAIFFGVADVLLGGFGAAQPEASGLVAVQNHLAGYVAGVLLIGPFARLAGRGDVAFTQ